MVVSGLDIKILKFEDDFRVWAKENGLRHPYDFKDNPPFIKDGDVWRQNPNYKKVEDNGYFEKLNLYVAKRIFNEIGYQEFLRYINVRHLEDLIEQDEYISCKAADGQCNIFCKYFTMNSCI